MTALTDDAGTRRYVVPMDRHLFPGWLEQLLGAAVLLAVLLDVFLHVLYARLGAGIFSYHVAHAVWRLFHGASKLFARWRVTILTYCGPAVLVALIVTWALGLTLGTALIIHPALGTGVVATDGQTTGDFLSALYAGGASVAIVGSSQFAPRTDAYRLLFLINSLVGLSVLSLTLMYLMQVYSALHRRNTLGLHVHLASAQTGDAAEMLAHLMPRGQVEGGYANLSTLGEHLVAAEEGHHFYPVLFYFRFHEPYYAVSRFTLVSLDLATLIATALDDETLGWLKATSAVIQIRQASDLLATTLADTFLERGAPRDESLPEREVVDRWRRRYLDALLRLRRAGIATAVDVRAGADAYVAARARWDRHVSALAPVMGYSVEQIDPASHRARPARPSQRQPRHGAPSGRGR